MSYDEDIELVAEIRTQLNELNLLLQKAYQQRIRLDISSDNPYLTDGAPLIHFKNIRKLMENPEDES